MPVGHPDMVSVVEVFVDPLTDPGPEVDILDLVGGV